MRRKLFLSFLPFAVALLAEAKPPLMAVPVYTYQVVKAYPHDPDAYTQGLVMHDGTLYESTGLQGESTLRRVDLNNGSVLQKREIPEKFFGEGLAWSKDNLVQITWQDHVGTVYDPLTMEPKKTFSYPTEGWGLTSDGKSLILSDGSETLYFLDPETFQETRRITVKELGKAVPMLNELEYVKGEIFANVYQSDRIARINPKTGEVTGWIDLTGLLPASERTGTVDVLNGIAYDAKQDRLFVTGKLWPKLYEIKLVKVGGR